MRKLKVNTNFSERPNKPIPQAKRVSPPEVPEPFQHSNTSSYGTIEDDLNSLYSSVPTDQNRPVLSKKIMENLTGIKHKIEGVSSKRELDFCMDNLSHKCTAQFHHQFHQQEDQGIDITQSPGRNSPCSSSSSAGSGSRHSTASLDSGRASTYITSASNSSNYDGSSSPHFSANFGWPNVGDGNYRSHDFEVIHGWLSEMNFEEYTQNFSSAGYDFPTISRMTPEDLTAIGIQNPSHRKKIKQHIDILQQYWVESLPNYVPDTIDEWLHLLRLDDYKQNLIAQGYQSVTDVTELIWDDLEDIGIVKLGHQKKILLAIKRVKDIINGKYIPAEKIQALYPSHKSMDVMNDMNAISNFRQSKHMMYSNPLSPAQIKYKQYSDMNAKPDSFKKYYDDGDITRVLIETNYRPHNSRTLPHDRKSLGFECVSFSQNASAALTDYVNNPESNSKNKFPSTVDMIEPMQLTEFTYPLPLHGRNNSFKQSFSVEKKSEITTAAEINQCASIDSIDTLPFANEHAGTIKQRPDANNLLQKTPPCLSTTAGALLTTQHSEENKFNSNRAITVNTAQGEIKPAKSDVLTDISNMLANLTNDLDLMLKNENIQ